MPARPYFSSSFDELLAETKDNWSNRAILGRVALELEHRTTVKAGKLKRDIQRRLSELPDGESASGPSAKAQDRGEERMREALARAEKAEEEVIRLRELLAKAREDASGQAKSPIERLYCKYGLSSTCDDDVLEAVQRVYRKRFHPDTFTDRKPEEQRYATRMFQEVEVDFSDLRENRG